MDAGAGKSAFDLAVSFKRNGSIGSAIVSKMDRHPNGGGTLSALVSTITSFILLDYIIVLVYIHSIFLFSDLQQQNVLLYFMELENRLMHLKPLT